MLISSDIFLSNTEEDYDKHSFIEIKERIKIDESFKKALVQVLRRKLIIIATDKLNEEYSGYILERQTFENNRAKLNEKIKTVLGKKLIIFLQNVKNKNRRSVKKQMNKERNRADSQKMKKMKKRMSLKQPKNKAFKAIFGIRVR